MSRFDGRLWLSLLMAVVNTWNLQAAFDFLNNPNAYTAAFELSGIPGAAAVSGVAVLFVMWNIPYLVANTNRT